MSDPAPRLIPLGPFAGIALTPVAGGGVIVSDRDGLGLATVLLRKAKREALAQRFREALHVELPQGPHRASADGFALVGLGPGSWLATQERGSNKLAMSLAVQLGELASVADQSDAIAVLRLSGPPVRDALSKLVPVDVHPLAFRIGDVATTFAAHIGATLWRLEDRNDGSPIFEIAIFRSFAASFWYALSESTGEFGIRLCESQEPLG